MNCYLCLRTRAKRAASGGCDDVANACRTRHDVIADPANLVDRHRSKRGDDQHAIGRHDQSQLGVGYEAPSSVAVFLTSLGSTQKIAP